MSSVCCGVEVDFIVKLRSEIWAIEVKSGEVQEQDLRGLKAFRDYFPKVDHSVCVSPKETGKRKIKGMLICHWITLLQEMGL